MPLQGTSSQTVSFRLQPWHYVLHKKKKLEIACLPMATLFCLYFYLYYTCSITNALTGYKHNIAVQLNSPIYAFKDKARYVT